MLNFLDLGEKSKKKKVKSLPINHGQMFHNIDVASELRYSEPLRSRFRDLKKYSRTLHLDQPSFPTILYRDERLRNEKNDVVLGLTRERTS